MLTVQWKKFRKLTKISILISFIFGCCLAYYFFFDCFHCTVSLMRNSKSEEILRVLGDRNTSAKVLPLSVDTTLLNPTKECEFEGWDVLAALFVLSEPENEENRNRIRTTWAQSRFQNSESMRVFFIVGESSSDVRESLKTEAEKYGDLIVDNFQENYYALPLKVLRTFKWFLNHCPGAKFLIKVDDDVVMNLLQLSLQLRAWPKESHLGGYIIDDGQYHLWNPHSKWYVPPELWSGGTDLPIYLEGPSYVVQGEILPKLFHACMDTPLFHLEDVFITGMVANEELQLSLRHMEGIVKVNYLNLWFYRNYFLGLCNYLYIHTKQDYDFFMWIFNTCHSADVT